MATIKEVVEIMQTINGGLSTINCAPTDFTDYPRKEIPRVELPIALVYPDEAQWLKDRISCQFGTEVRTYTIKVLVTDTNTGLEGEHICDIANVIDEMGFAYLDSNNTLNTTSDVRIDYNAPITDTGYLELMFHADKPYHGFEMSVTVIRDC